MFCASVSANILADGLGRGLATPWRIGSWCRTCGENSPRLMIEHFYPFEVAIPLQKSHQRLEIHMEKASGMKKTNAAWCADIFRSGTTFELLVVDEGSRQIILRSPVDLADASSVINLLRGAFNSFGPPAEIRTDAGTIFASALFCDLMHSCGISHTIMRSPAQKGLAERLVRTELSRPIVPE
jgi:hypothetical protein